MYPTQYNKIVIEVIYCVCLKSELNRWVIFFGKKSNYELSLNCLRERQTLGMFFFSTFLLSLSCFLMSFFLFLLFLYPLLPPPLFAIFSRFPFSPFSPVLHSFMLSSGFITFSCPPPSFPFFHSITTLSAPHLYHFHSIVLFISFVSFDIL